MSKDHYRRETHKRKKLSKTWRRPKGMHSKVRRKERYTIQMPSSRIRSPAETRGLHPSGKEAILVHNSKELLEIDPKTQVARLAKIGKRKKLIIWEKAKKNKIEIVNLDQKKIDKIIQEHKKKKQVKKSEKKKKAKEKKKKGKKKPKKKAKKKKAKKKKKSKDYKSMTKKEIYEIAQKLDISGRSKMNKKELIKAVKSEKK